MSAVSNDERPKRNLSVLWRIAGLLAPYRPRVFLAGVALLLGSVVGLGYPQIAGFAIDHGIKAQNANALNEVLRWLVLIFVVHATFVWLRHYLISWLGARVVTDLRTRVFDHILVLPLSWFHERRSGELVGRLAADVGLIEEVIGSQISMAVRNAVQLIGGMALLIVVSWKLTLVMLCVVPPFVLGAVYFGAVLRRRARMVQDRLADASGRVQESIGGIRTVQAFVRESDEACNYRSGVEGAFRETVRLTKWRASFFSLVSVLTYAAIAVILLIGGRAVIQGEMTAGELTKFLMYTAIVASSLATIASLYGSLQRASGAAERLFDIIDTVPAVVSPPNPKPLPPAPHAVHIDNVSFTYPSRPDLAVLDKITVDIRPGQLVALVGSSGAGKSTIAALIPRFYDVNIGSVRINDVDVRDLDLTELRRNIAMVDQEPILFSGSIKENIAYAKPLATDEEIIQAATKANARDFIQSFPDGFKTLVGERGVKLSGGQKQRIAIARALLADPRILILDEATSSLDSQSEAAVQEALSVLMKGRTTLVIAHRLSTVKDADQIVVIENGRVSERGKHTELMETNGMYRRLVQHQILAA